MNIRLDADIDFILSVSSMSIQLFIDGIQPENVMKEGDLASLNFELFRNKCSVFCSFETDISYNQFSDKKYNLVKEEISTKGWYHSIKEILKISLSFIKNQKTIEKLLDEKNLMIYIIFHIFYLKSPIYLMLTGCDSDSFFVYITDKKDISQNPFVISDSIVLCSTLSQMRGWFGDGILMKINESFGEFGQEKVVDMFENFFRDIRNITAIEDFKNCRISAELREGEPYYMEAETKTNNANFGHWRETLGPYRKIEENATDGKINSLKITKKHKYGNNSKKGL